MFFGPGDYSLALGIPGQLQHPEIKAVRARIAEVARRHGKIAATATFVSQLKESLELRKQNTQENIGWYEGVTADIFG